MRQNSKNRFNARYNNRGFRPQVILRNTALDSNGPCGKLHGTALQLFEKYQTAAKDAMIQNDAVLAETCLQFADHYMRIQNQAIANEEAARAAAAFRRPQEQKQTASIETDELPKFETPAIEQPAENTNEAESLPESLSDESSDKIKDMDLSVPVLAIQENHASEQPRTRRAPRVKKENAPE